MRSAPHATPGRGRASHRSAARPGDLRADRRGTGGRRPPQPPGADHAPGAPRGRRPRHPRTNGAGDGNIIGPPGPARQPSPGIAGDPDRGPRDEAGIPTSAAGNTTRWWRPRPAMKTPRCRCRFRPRRRAWRPQRNGPDPAAGPRASEGRSVAAADPTRRWIVPGDIGTRRGPGRMHSPRPAPRSRSPRRDPGGRSRPRDPRSSGSHGCPERDRPEPVRWPCAARPRERCCGGPAGHRIIRADIGMGAGRTRPRRDREASGMTRTDGRSGGNPAHSGKAIS